MREIALILFIAFFSNTDACKAQGWLWGATSNFGGTNLEYGLITVDNKGNSFICGYTPGAPGFPYNVYTRFGPYVVRDSGFHVQTVVAKVDSNGRYLWAIGTQGADTYPCGLATDQYGNTYVFGVFYNTGICRFGGRTVTTTDPSVASYFLAKVNPLGNVQYLRNIARTTLFSSDYQSGSVVVDQTGAVIVSGVFDTVVSVGSTTLTNFSNSRDVFVAKFDTSGSNLWVKTLYGSGTDDVNSIAVDHAGNVCVAGTTCSPAMFFGTSLFITNDSTPAPIVYLANYDANGHEKWIRNTVNNTATTVGQAITDKWGNIYLTGGFKQSDLIFGNDTLHLTAESNAFLTKYDSSGNVKWVKSLGDSLFYEGYTAAADECGNIWISGFMPTALDTPYIMHVDGHIIAPPPNSLDPAFFVEYDSSGAYISGFATPTLGDDENSLAVDNRGYFYIGGDYDISPFVVGSDTLRLDSSSESLCLLKYRYNLSDCVRDTLPVKGASVVEANLNAPEVNVFPNPTRVECTINISGDYSGEGKLEIYDVTGRLLDSLLLKSNDTEFSPLNLNPGVYILRICIKEYVVTKRLVVTG